MKNARPLVFVMLLAVVLAPAALAEETSAPATPDAAGPAEVLECSADAVQMDLIVPAPLPLSSCPSTSQAECTDCCFANAEVCRSACDPNDDPCLEQCTHEEICCNCVCGAIPWGMKCEFHCSF